MARHAADPLRRSSREGGRGPIVVAINKVNKQANPGRVMQQLSEHGLVPTQWNGDTEMVQILHCRTSASTTSFDVLLITADLEESTANPDARAPGVVPRSPPSTSVVAR